MSMKMCSYPTRSMCKVLENRSQQDEGRMDQLSNQLKEARMLAEDADTKSDEVSRKLAFVEDELEVAEDRVKSGEAKIMELEEELKVGVVAVFSLNGPQDQNVRSLLPFCVGCG